MHQPPHPPFFTKSCVQCNWNAHCVLSFLFFLQTGSSGSRTYPPDSTMQHTSVVVQTKLQSQTHHCNLWTVVLYVFQAQRVLVDIFGRKTEIWIKRNDLDNIFGQCIATCWLIIKSLPIPKDDSSLSDSGTPCRWTICCDGPSENVALLRAYLMRVRRFGQFWPLCLAELLLIFWCFQRRRAWHQTENLSFCVNLKHVSTEFEVHWNASMLYCDVMSFHFEGLLPLLMQI